MRQLFLFILGVLIGGLVGGLLGLLFAPATGEQTRTLIREKAFDLCQLARDACWCSEEAYDWMGEAACEAEALPGDIGKGDSA